MKKNISLSIFFPAYNEEASIEKSVAAAENAAKKITDQYEILIINDGSSDRTEEIADRLAAENPHVRAIHQVNQGYGGAVWTGIQSARYEYVFFTDADLQFDLDELPLLAEYVPEYDVVLGYRAKRKDPFMRLVNAKGWNVLNRALFGLKVRDIDCAFKLMRRDLVASLPIQNKTAMMSAEMLIRLSRKGIVFKEVPVTHLPRTAGSPTGAKPAVIVRALRSMGELYVGDLGNPHALELLRFAAVGVMNTTIDLGLYTILTRGIPFFGTELILAKTLSFMAGATSSYLGNKNWTFKKHGVTDLAELVRFGTATLSSLLINTSSLYLFHSVLGIHDLVSVLLATVVTFSWNFILSKFWVFKKETSSPIAFSA